LYIKTAATASHSVTFATKQRTHRVTTANPPWSQ